MIKWIKRQNTTVKMMLVLIVLFIIGIILRWDYIGKEAGDAFKGIFRNSRTEQALQVNPHSPMHGSKCSASPTQEQIGL